MRLFQFLGTPPPRWSRLAASTARAAAVLVCLAPLCVAGQNAEFVFDPAGNFAAETSETSSPPQILGQPQNQIVQPGDTASFSVVVSDARNMIYQWWFNSNAISGAIGPTLLVPNVAS